MFVTHPEGELEPGMVKPLTGLVDAAVQEAKAYTDGLCDGLGSRMATLEKDQASLYGMLKHLSDATASLAAAVSLLNDAIAGDTGRKS